MRAHVLVPKATTGYVLSKAGYFSLVVPEAGVNLILNPDMVASGGIASVVDGYSVRFDPALGGGPPSYTLDYTDKVRGLNSVHMAGWSTGQGFCSRPTGFVAGASATFSFDHKGVGFFKITARDATGAEIESKSFTGVDSWQRYHMTVDLPSNLTAAPYLCVEVESGIATFNVDGYQYENNAYESTYMSGNMGAGYGWTGLPNYSSSYRTASASGGKIVPLADMGLQLTGFSGLGLPEPDFNMEPYAVRRGSAMIGVGLEQREFTIAGIICGKNICDLLCKRAPLTYRLSPYASDCPRPITLLFQPLDRCDLPCGECLQIDAYYAGGLEGDFQSLYQEQVAIDFVAVDPYFYACNETTESLDLTEQVPSSLVMGQGADGAWGAVGTSLTALPISTRKYPVGPITDAEIAPDGKLYVSGHFNSTTGNRSIMAWNGEAEEMVGLATSPIYDMASSPDGSLYVGMSQGVIAGPNNSINCGGFARFNLRTKMWEDLAGVDNGRAVYALDVAPDGRVIFGGNFVNVNATTGNDIAANRIAQYFPATDTFMAMGGGLGLDVPTAGTDTVYTIEVSDENFVWAGGRFRNGGLPDTDVHNISYFNGGTWMYVDPPMMTTQAGNLADKVNAATVYDIEFDGSRVYIGGKFDQSLKWYNLGLSIDAPLNNVAYLDSPYTSYWQNMDYGVWDPLGAVVGGIDYRAHVTDLEFVNGQLWVAGTFRQAGTNLESIIDAQGSVIWDGQKWVSTGVIPPATTAGGVPYYTVNALAVGSAYQFSPTGVSGSNIPTSTPNAGLYMGGPWSTGSITVPAVNALDLGCAVDAQAVITLEGRSNIQAIVNHANGTRIDFAYDPNGWNIGAGERITIDLGKSRKTITDSKGKSRYSLLQAGSVLGSFRLTGGVNELQVIGEISPLFGGKVSITYRKRYLSGDALCGEAC